MSAKLSYLIDLALNFRRRDDWDSGWLCLAPTSLCGADPDMVIFCATYLQSSNAYKKFLRLCSR